MKVSITGYSGYIGNFLKRNLGKKFHIKNINLRKLPELGSKKYDFFVNNLISTDVIINCAGNLNPKTERDFFINQEFPFILQEKIKNLKRKPILIHLSTINTIIDGFKDDYTKSKKEAERKLNKNEVVILRLPLIYTIKKEKIQNEGQMKYIHNYLNYKLIPIYPMFFKGNTYQPVEVKNLYQFILKIIKTGERKNLYNLVGKNKKTLWDLFNSVAENKNKKILKIKIGFFKKVLPNFLKKYLMKKKNIFQQILEIDSTKFNGKKTVLDSRI